MTLVVHDHRFTPVRENMFHSWLGVIVMLCDVPDDEPIMVTKSMFRYANAHIDVGEHLDPRRI